MSSVAVIKIVISINTNTGISVIVIILTVVIVTFLIYSLQNLCGKSACMESECGGTHLLPRRVQVVTGRQSVFHLLYTQHIVCTNVTMATRIVTILSLIHI